MSRPHFISEIQDSTLQMRYAYATMSIQHSPSQKPTIKKENIYTLPNILSFSRLLMTPGIGYLIVEHCYTEALIGLSIAAVTDLLDGFIARRYNQRTFVGSALDPMADKVLVSTLVVSLAHVQLLPGSLFV